MIDWRKHLHLSSHSLSPEATDLITRLCCEAEKRLGNGLSGFAPKNDRRPVTIVGAEEIKKHPFFGPIDWSRDLRKQTAPYIPLTHSADDTSNFDRFPEDKSLFPVEEEDRDERDKSNPAKLPHRVPSNSGLGQKNHQFYEFTFHRFFGDVDCEVFKTKSIRSSSGSYELPGAVAEPVNHRQSQCLLEEQDSWIPSQSAAISSSSSSTAAVAASSSANRGGATTLNFAYDPPPYSVALATSAESVSRGGGGGGKHLNDSDSSRDSRENVPVYV